MSFEKSLRRKWEKQKLNNEISRMLTEMKVSRRIFKKTMPKMEKEGYKYGVSEHGGRASLRQKYMFLKGVYDWKIEQDRKDKEEKEKQNAK